MATMKISLVFMNIQKGILIIENLTNNFLKTEQTAQKQILEFKMLSVSVLWLQITITEFVNVKV